MNTRILSRLVLATALLFPVLSEAAVMVDVGSTIRLSDGIGNTGGGRFGVTGTNSASQVLDTFDTFCVETGVNQYIGFNEDYRVVAIGLMTSGKPGDTSTMRTLTSKVAWAYNAFRTSNVDATYGLAGFNYAHQTSANQLQYFIWNNLSPSYGVSGSYPSTWNTNYQNAVDDGIWSGVGHVRIMQLETAGGTTKQDQLALIPEATSLATWSVMAAVLAFGRSRRRDG